MANYSNMSEYTDPHFACHTGFLGTLLLMTD